MANDITFPARLIRFFLLTCGVHVSQERTHLQKIHFKIILGAIFVLIAPQFAYLFRHNDQLYETLDCIVYILHAIHDSSVAITFYITSRSFIYILDNMRFNLDSYTGLLEPARKAELDEKTSGRLKKVALISYGSYVAIILSPVFSIIFADEIVNPEQSLIVTAVYPWSMQSRLAFMLTYLLQLSVVLVMSSCVPSNCVFLFYFSAEISAQKLMLLTMVKTVQAAAEKSVERQLEATDAYRRPMLIEQKSREQQLDDKLCQNIMLCVDYHKRLIRFIEHFVSCYKWIFVLNLLYSTCVFTLNFYLLVAGDSYLPKFVQRVFELLLIFPYFFVYCYIGEAFKDVNSALQNALYNLNWYEKSVRFQKIVLFLLTRTQRDLDLKFSNTLLASYAMFASVIKASYTYANFLLNAYR